MPLVDLVDRDVELVGALNTIVVFAQDGAPARLTGHNTDIAGIQAAIMEARLGELDCAVVLGAGGTARAAVAAAAAYGIGNVIVAARDVDRTAGLVAMGERLGIEIEGAPWSALRAELAVTDLVISTTPAGATDSLADPTIWRDGVPLVDVVYDPWPTALARYAALRGSAIVGGMAVLAAQAAEQFAEMTGQSPPSLAIRAAGEQALVDRGFAT
ncbi:MAG: shikimate dehydrogenase [Frankiaceae bacterium]|nr:shikimate dehydrogenase [Frankiaceae bacterium]